MSGRFRRQAFAAIAADAMAVGIPVAAASGHEDRGHGHGHHHRAIKHLLLISVDGLHQSDLEWYVANHPGSELAKLTTHGAEYASAHTPVPSDSDPGMTAQMTGGNPREHRRLLRRRVQPRAVPAGDDVLHGHAARCQRHLRLAG